MSAALYLRRQREPEWTSDELRALLAAEREYGDQRRFAGHGGPEYEP